MPYLERLPVFIILSSITLSACQLKLEPGPDGYIESKNPDSTQYNCADDLCEFEINGISETFVANPYPDYEFVRWEGHEACHNKTTPECLVFLPAAPEAWEIYLPYFPDVELKAIFQRIVVVEPEPEPETQINCDELKQSPTTLLTFGAPLINEVIEQCTSTNTPEPPVFIGWWQSTCYQVEDGLWSIQALEVVSDALMHVSAHFFKEEHCLLTVDNIHFSATYILGDTVPTEAGSPEKAFKIDLTILEEPNNPPDAGLVVEDLVFLQGETLYFGVENDDGSRPDEIDFTNPYIVP